MHGLAILRDARRIERPNGFRQSEDHRSLPDDSAPSAHKSPGLAVSLGGARADHSRLTLRFLEWPLQPEAVAQDAPPASDAGGDPVRHDGARGLRERGGQFKPATESRDPVRDLHIDRYGHIKQPDKLDHPNAPNQPDTDRELIA